MAQIAGTMRHSTRALSASLIENTVLGTIGATKHLSLPPLQLSLADTRSLGYVVPVALADGLKDQRFSTDDNTQLQDLRAFIRVCETNRGFDFDGRLRISTEQFMDVRRLRDYAKEDRKDLMVYWDPVQRRPTTLRYRRRGDTPRPFKYDYRNELAIFSSPSNSLHSTPSRPTSARRGQIDQAISSLSTKLKSEPLSDDQHAPTRVLRSRSGSKPPTQSRKSNISAGRAKPKPAAVVRGPLKRDHPAMRPAK